MSSSSIRVPLIRYFQVVAAHKKFIFFVTLAGAGLSIVVSLLLPKKYEARALIMPPQVDQSIMSSFMSQAGTLGGMADIFGKNSQSDVYASLLTSDAVKNPVITKFNYLKEYPTRVDALKAIGEKATIDTGKKDGIVSVTVEDEDPQHAADVANAFVEELNKLVMSMNIQDAGQNRQFLEGRLVQAKTEMERLETKLKAFRTTTKTVDVGEQVRATIDGIAALKVQLATQEVRLAELRTSHTDNSPLVLNVKAAVGNLRRQISALEGNGRGGGLPTLGSVPALGEEYGRLQRDLKIQEALLEGLTKQYELARLTETKTVPSVIVIQRADVPDKKARPKRSVIVILATFASFAGAVAASFFREAVGRLPHAERAEWQALWHTMKCWRRPGNL